MQIKLGRTCIATLSAVIVASTGIAWIEKSAAIREAVWHSPDDIIVYSGPTLRYMNVYEGPFVQGEPIYLSEEPTVST